MGILKFIKGQLLKVVEWTDETSDTVVYRFPMNGQQLMYGSKLTVRESQIAVFVNKGQIADIFTPGMHKLEARNLPILTKLNSWKYGFNSPFFSEVYFVNTKQFTNQKWGTSNPIAMRDKDFGTIRIRGYGAFSFKVADAGLFLKELFGTSSTFKTEDISNYLKTIVVAGISDTIAESKISALDLAANLLEFNEMTKVQIAHKFEEMGLSLVRLIVENISFPEQVEKAIDTRSSMGVMGDQMDTFVKYQAAHAMRDAAQNPNGGGLASTGVGLGAGVALGQTMAEALRPSAKKEEVEKEDPQKFCPECGAKVRKNAKFCPDCGHGFKEKGICPSCGVEVKLNAKFCPDCGEKLKA
jgi:membrane protease subunit (stomatin/prohibitin family)